MTHSYLCPTSHITLCGVAAPPSNRISKVTCKECLAQHKAILNLEAAYAIHLPSRPSYGRV